MPDIVLVLALAAGIAGSVGLVGLATDQVSSALLETGASAISAQAGTPDRTGG